MKFAYVSLLVATALAGCGGGGSSGSGDSQSQQTNQSPGGYWSTQYTVTSGQNTGDTIKAVAIVTETGQFYYAARNQNNGCAEVGFGQASVTGNTISGNADAAVVQWSTIPGVNTTCAYPDGSTSAKAAITGTVDQRSTMTLTTDASTSMGTALGTETYTWAFDAAIYDAGSSLSMIAGNYSDGNNTLSVSASGVVFEQDPSTGCVFNGQISLINSTYNAYSVSLTISNCMGSAAAANGSTLTGLAALDQSVSPTELEFGISGTVSGQEFVYIGEAPKQ